MTRRLPTNALSCALVLGLLALRVLVPAGYMPASAGSGLFFELCPDGLPDALISAFSGSQGHYHHGRGGDATAVSTADQCPIGHMLSSAMAVDEIATFDWLPTLPSFRVESPKSTRLAIRVEYLTRAPPA